MTTFKDLHDKDIFDNPIEAQGEYFVRPTVKGILIDNENRVALLKVRNHYGLPGGGVEEGEDYVEAYKREIMEEVGCETDIIELIGTSKQYRNKPMRHYIIHYYLSRVKGGKGAPTTTQVDEVSGIEILWMTRDEAYKCLKDQADIKDENEYAHCFNVRSHLEAYEYFYNNLK